MPDETNPNPDAEVSTDFNGRQYRGTFRVEGDMPVVLVDSEFGSDSAPLGDGPAMKVAALLLRQIIERKRP